LPENFPILIEIKKK